MYDYVDGYVPMLARMCARRLKGYNAIGYAIEQEPAASAAERIELAGYDGGSR